MYDNIDQQPLDESQYILYMFTKDESRNDFGDTLTYSTNIRLIFMV